MGTILIPEVVRRDLLDKGYTFNSYSDTEVLLTSYIEYGQDCVNKIDGIYAFAIWDDYKKNYF